jgi:hypothetical protein
VIQESLDYRQRKLLSEDEFPSDLSIIEVPDSELSKLIADARSR